MKLRHATRKFLIIVSWLGLLSGCANPSHTSRPQDVSEIDPLAQRIVYFVESGVGVTRLSMRAIQAHAAYLQGHPDLRITLRSIKSHDGAKPSTVDLQNRRLNTVRSLLIRSGASPSLVSVASETPADESRSSREPISAGPVLIDYRKIP